MQIPFAYQLSSNIASHGSYLYPKNMTYLSRYHSLGIVSTTASSFCVYVTHYDQFCLLLLGILPKTKVNMINLNRMFLPKRVSLKVIFNFKIDL